MKSEFRRPTRCDGATARQEAERNSQGQDPNPDFHATNLIVRSTSDGQIAGFALGGLHISSFKFRP